MAAIQKPHYQSISGIQQGDKRFRRLLQICALVGPALLVIMTVLLVLSSLETIGKFGFSFFTSSKWDPSPDVLIFGALPYIFGTVVTSVIALLVATPLAVGAALFVSEYAPRWLGSP